MVSVVSKVGIRLPAHATGPGKVLLAFSPADITEQVITAGLSRCTPRTITDPQELRSALADVRRTGVCLTRDEMSLGASSVAAPVFDHQRAVAAAVSVVVPSDTANLATLIPAVRTACLGITRSFSQVRPVA